MTIKNIIGINKFLVVFIIREIVIPFSVGLTTDPRIDLVIAGEAYEKSPTIIANEKIGNRELSLYT